MPAESIKPDTVIAVVNGKPYTADEMDRLMSVLSPVNKQMFMRDPKTFLEGYALFDVFAGMAEKNKLDQKSPYKEKLAALRREVLVQAESTEYKNSIPVMPADQKKYYEANPDKFKETKVKMIQIRFATGSAEPDGKKPIPEAEAKAKAENIVRLARSGVDFVKLVKEHSEDPGTVSHNGDLGIAVRAGSTNVPANVKSAILALKEGEVSNPIREQNGYVVVRAESISVASYDQVKDEIFQEIKDAAFRKFVDETRKSTTVKIENNAYFQQPGGPK